MKIPENIGSKYRLIVLSGQRVTQLQKGATPRIEKHENMKMTRIAIQELLDEKLPFHKIQPFEEEVAVIENASYNIPSDIESQAAAFNSETPALDLEENASAKSKETTKKDVAEEKDEAFDPFALAAQELERTEGSFNKNK